MDSLVEIVDNLKKEPINETIKNRMKEFESFRNKSSNEIFRELCFCLMTANFSASGGIKIQNEIGKGFFNLSESELAKKLSELGHRFPNARAKYIILAQPFKDNIKEILEKIKDEIKMREWVVENVKGIGMKEASHFLRNIGYKNLAIIDFHIIDLLVRNNLIKKPKTITPRKYIEIENLLRELANKTNTNLGELDLYLWYAETGKVLK